MKTFRETGLNNLDYTVEMSRIRNGLEYRGVIKSEPYDVTELVVCVGGMPDMETAEGVVWDSFCVWQGWDR